MKGRQLPYKTTLIDVRTLAWRGLVSFQALIGEIPLLFSQMIGN